MGWNSICRDLLPWTLSVRVNFRSIFLVFLALSVCWLLLLFSPPTSPWYSTAFLLLCLASATVPLPSSQSTRQLQHRLIKWCLKLVNRWCPPAALVAWTDTSRILKGRNGTIEIPEFMEYSFRSTKLMLGDQKETGSFFWRGRIRVLEYMVPFEILGKTSGLLPFN